MTNKEWNAAIEWLENGEEGDYVENEGRTAEVVNMCGGRYLLTDENGEVADLVDEAWRAVSYLRNDQ